MKTAIVTGASRGIGRAVAKRLSQSGFEVALLARSKEALEDLSNEISSEGGKAIPLPCDVSDLAAVSQCIKSLRGEWDELTLLFNNAGANRPGTVELSPEDFETIYRVNVFGAYNVLHEVVPWLKSQSRGTIVNLASIAGITGFPGAGAYCSSKFALRGLNEALHHELEPLGIRVSAISPSWVDTDMASHCPYPKDKMILPEEIADAVLYLESLSSNISVKELVIGCRSDLS